MTETNKDILRAGYAAFNRQDTPGITGFLDENIEWTEPEGVYGPPGGTLHGRDEVLRKVFEPIAGLFDTFGLDPREYYGEGDTVVIVGSFKLRPKGVGQTVDVPFAHVWRLRNGKCVSMRNYVDVGELYGRQELRRAAGDLRAFCERRVAAEPSRASRLAAAFDRVSPLRPRRGPLHRSCDAPTNRVD